MPKVYIFLGIFLILILYFVIVMIMDTHRFVERYYTIKTPKINRDLRFVFISDLHNKTFGKENETLCKRIEELKPDGILLGGDILTAHPDEDYSVALQLVRRLAKDYPVYYGEGNHEHRLHLYEDVYGDMGKRYEGELKASNISIMRNEKAVSENWNIAVTGLSIDRSYYKRFRKIKMETSYVTELVGKPDTDRFQILLAHNPQYAESYANWGADLTLCGHVHGGLMKLPLLGGVISPNLTLFPKYDGGEFRFGEKRIIVSRGLGTHTLPVRIWNPGELVVINLCR